MRLCLAIVAVCALLCQSSALGDPIGSVTALIGRLLGPSYETAFVLEVIPSDNRTGNDVFELDFSGGKPVIRGNSGVAIASGLHWYLKYSVNASISWGRDGSGNQLSTVPPAGALPPPVGGPSRTVSTVRYKYAYNVCTFGYSLPWYDSKAWADEIDRLALWGVNLPLGFFMGAQESVLRAWYLSLGLTAAEVDAFISGPAFLPWQRMGNMQVRVTTGVGCAQ
jgi:alpha-N-acetylglucosaminidase